MEVIKTDALLIKAQKMLVDKIAKALESEKETINLYGMPFIQRTHVVSCLEQVIKDIQEIEFITGSDLEDD